MLSQFDKLIRNVHQGSNFRIFGLDGVGQVQRLGEGQRDRFGLAHFDKNTRNVNRRINSPILYLSGPSNDQGTGERVFSALAYLLSEPSSS